MCENCDDIQKNADTVITQMMIRHARVETALENLFQACSRLCLDDMNKLEAEIKEASAALGAAQPSFAPDAAVPYEMAVLRHLESALNILRAQPTPRR
jgi:hypothetical protein